MVETVTIQESSELQVKVSPHSDHLRVAAIGKITESATFERVREHLRACAQGEKTIEFDLGQVTELNSGGVRSWLLLMQDLEAHFRCRFAMVTESFVELAEFVPNILGRPGTSIQAFEAAYFCPTCVRRLVRVLSIQEITMSDTSFIPPSQRCDKCNSELDFDSFPEQYFRLIVRSKSAGAQT